MSLEFFEKRVLFVCVKKIYMEHEIRQFTNDFCMLMVFIEMVKKIKPLC